MTECRSFRRGFNRNIMECKYHFHSRILVVHPVLIETLWNVNKGDLILYDEFVGVLIETLWNVNKICCKVSSWSM